MEVKLVVLGGKHAGQQVPVPHCKFLIGRAEDCHLRAASDLISRHHAVILVDEGFVTVRDFASRNGTFVNGERITKERELKAGDRLKIGPLEFEVRLDLPLAAKRKPKVHTVQEAAARTVENVQTAPDGEPDISELIGDDEDAPTGDTRPAAIPPVEASATVGTEIGDTATLPATPSKEEDSQARRRTDEDKETKPKKPMSFAERVKAAKNQPSAADSGTAAADVLRKFFGRKS